MREIVRRKALHSTPRVDGLKSDIFCHSLLQAMAGVDGLVKFVSYYLNGAATTEESGNDDAAADAAVLNEPMVTEESIDLPTPALDNFEDDTENNGVEQGESKAD